MVIRAYETRYYGSPSNAKNEPNEECESKGANQGGLRRLKPPPLNF